MDLEPRATHPNRKCDPDYDKEFSVVGKTGYRRLDGWEKVSGTAMFARDVRFPRVLFYARIINLSSCPCQHKKHGYQQSRSLSRCEKNCQIRQQDNDSNRLYGL